MDAQMEVVLWCIAITACIQWCGFLAAYLLQTEKFYDILGGVNFFALAVYTLVFSPSDGMQPWTTDSRKLAMTFVFVCSRGWLLLFLAWRAHERQGDARFDEVKDKFFQFLVFWTVQGVWCLCISLPLLLVNSSTVQNPQFSAFDTVALTCFALGVILEVTADIQKAAWVKAGRLGTFCQTGVWSLSRHPNYFGEMLQWWSAWALAYSSSTGLSDGFWWACILSPVFTMQILLNTPATGVAQANGKSLKRYYDKCPEEYAKYRKNTSILMPMVGYQYVPVFLKRTLFLDLAKYEYRPGKEQATIDGLRGLLADGDSEGL